jgi:AAA15 family ATPase/GTPase
MILLLIKEGKSMAVNRVEIKDFLVFKGEFAMDFCPGINVLIGSNGTGKTTLLKIMYVKTNKVNGTADNGVFVFHQESLPDEKSRTFVESAQINNCVYIPEKDILEHARGLLPFIEEKNTGFSRIYRDMLITAQDVYTKKQTETQEAVGDIITAAIGGRMEWNQSTGMFYTVRTDGTIIPYANEASGFKKLGFLGLLVASGHLGPGSVLFWDEPENSLNPELAPVLVDILLRLSRSGVQVFIATHSEILSEYFGVLREKTKGDEVKFFSLYKDGEQIKYDADSRFDLLRPNNLMAESVKVYELEIDRGFGGNG